MPKLQNRPPQCSRIGKYAVVYLNGKKNYLGLHGSPEAKAAYARLEAEWWTNAQNRSNPTFYLQKRETNTTVKELAVAFLDHAKRTLASPNYSHYRIMVVEFLVKLYGDNTPANEFKPKCLWLEVVPKLVSFYFPSC